MLYKNRKFFITIFVLLTGIIFLYINTASAQTDADLHLQEFIGGVNDALNEKSLDPGEFLTDSFFDVFVETVLREGLPADVDDPVLGRSLKPDEVTRTLREDLVDSDGVNPLFEALGTAIGPNNTEIDLTPGAAVYKWGYAGRWCKGPHKFQINTKAMVNQWIRASMNKTNIYWKVFKPGIYTTDCMYLNVHSNGKMDIQLQNMGPLVGPDGQEIPTKYALTDYFYTNTEVFPNDKLAEITGNDPIVDWVTDPTAPGQFEVDQHKLVKVWNSVAVGSHIRPGEYSTDGPSAIITVVALDDV